VDARTRLAGLGLGLATVAALAAGCGSSSGDPASAPASQNAMTAYTTCLANNGVVLPSASARPGGNPSGRPSGRPSFGAGAGGGGFGGGGIGNQKPANVDQATWDKAQQACASVRPSFGANGGGAGGGAANNSALAAYRNCLSEHGVTASTGPNTQLNTADPTVAAAVSACAALRPTG
jgi:hypothetical protein